MTWHLKSLGNCGRTWKLCFAHKSAFSVMSLSVRKMSYKGVTVRKRTEVGHFDTIKFDGERHFRKYEHHHVPTRPSVCPLNLTDVVDFIRMEVLIHKLYNGYQVL